MNTSVDPQRPPASSSPSIYAALVFALVAVVGLYYVKWLPYFNRSFVAASHHSIGNSILMGTADHAPAPSWQSAFDYALAYGKAIWQALVLGLLLGSAVQSLLRPQWIVSALGRAGFGSVARGAALSLPGMMCTCCAAPVVVGLRRSHAAPGAALAFWLGNTVLNPATLVFMGFVLGWNWTALRLVLGVLMVLGLGYWANRTMTPAEIESSEQGLKHAWPRDDEGLNPFVRWIKLFLRMALRLLPEYLVLVLLLGAARAWLFPQVGPAVSDSMLWIIGFAVAGTLFVIPTAGEVPIIQAMLSLGVGVAPAAALLMTLPPVSLPSLAMTARSFRLSTLAVVTLVVIGFGIVAGLLALALHF